MKALVTGSAGFIGRHVSAELRARGWSVAGRDSADGNDALDYFARVNESCDLVVHCAAAEPHRAAIDGNAMNMVRNLHLDAAMFSWAVRTGTPVLYLSSSAAYPVRLQTSEWIDSHGPLALAELHINLTQWGRAGDWLPDAAYGWTKLTGEQMASAAAVHVPVCVVRPFSGYGEDQGENWPFGAFVARAKRREDPFVIWGDGRQVRDWIHVSDVVAGALALVDQEVYEPVNLCTGVGTSMLDLVQMICRQVGYEPEIELRLDRPAGVHYRVGDPSRLHKYYTPTVTIAEGVRRALKA